MPLRFVRLCAIVFATSLTMSVRANSTEPVNELKRLSIDELMNVEITSVSRREETLRDAAAALTSLKLEAEGPIRRSRADVEAAIRNRYTR